MIDGSVQLYFSKGSIELILLMRLLDFLGSYYSIFYTNNLSS